MKQVAYYKGCLASLSAKELDISTQALCAEARSRADRARGGDLLRRGRHPRGRARLLPPPECADPRVRRRHRVGHADDGLQRLHAQPPAGELPAADRHDAPRTGQRQPRAGRRAALRAATSTSCISSGSSAGTHFEELKAVAHHGLRGLKIAPFYGCQILRPSKLLGFEDPDKPSSLERIIEACGGEPIDYPAKIKCCGFPIIQAREDTALGELIQPIEQAKEAGADAIVTPCPLCHLSLDAWQSKLKKQTGKDFQMPILHLSQLIGVAAGLVDSELKFKRHVVSVEPVDREALASDPALGCERDVGARRHRRARARGPRVGLVRGGLGATPRARGSRSPACRPRWTASGSRTSPTSISGMPSRGRCHRACGRLGGGTATRSRLHDR